CRPRQEGSGQGCGQARTSRRQAPLMDEAEVVRRMMKRLNAIPGVYCLRTHGGAFQQKGTPDIIGCAHGYFFTIEAKRTAREKPTESQLYTLNKFSQAGG